MVERVLVETRELVRQLTQVEETDAPFLTVYLDTGFQNRHQQKGALRLFLKHMRVALERQFQDSPNFSELLTMLERLETSLDNLPSTVHGWAVFLRIGEDYFKTFESPLPFRNQWVVEPQPLISPLLQQLENHESLLAVFIDSRSAKIYEMTLHQITHQHQIESDVPGWHKQGGWSQLKYQHHIQDHKEHHYERVAERVSEMVDTNLYENIVLLGESENVSALQRHFPLRIKRLVVDTLPMAKYETSDRLLSRLKTLMDCFERQKEQFALEDVLDHSFSEGFAVVGVEDTLRATQLGQVDRLYVLEGLVLEGWRCPQCGLFGLDLNELKAAGSGCPYCSAWIQPASLVEELVLAVKRQDGSVEFIHHHDGLAQYGGLAARLRFKLEALR